MKCIQFDVTKDPSNLPADAFGIRIAYLLSDYMNLIGNSTFLMTLEPILKTFSLAQRLKILYNFPYCEPEFKLIAENYFDFQKQMRALKHPTNAVFLAGRKLEKTVEDIIQGWLDNFRVNLNKDGFIGLLELADYISFGLHHADSLPGKSSRGHLCTQEVINNQQPDGAVNNSIWMQSGLFYQADFFETMVATSVDMIEEDMPYFIKAFEFPNLNILNTIELKSIKAQFATELQPFKAMMDEWAVQCYKTGGKDYFIEKIVPSFAHIQEMIDNNPILHHLSSIKEGKVTASVYFGEVSPLIHWSFYYSHNLLSDIEYNLLVNNYNDLPNHTIPILLFLPTMDGLTLGEKEEETAEEEVPDTIQAVRKFINID